LRFAALVPYASSVKASGSSARTARPTRRKGGGDPREKPQTTATTAA